MTRIGKKTIQHGGAIGREVLNPRPGLHHDAYVGRQMGIMGLRTYRSELQTDLRNIFQKLGKTVVLVTHDLAEADFFGDTIVLLRDGRIVQQGTLDNLEQQPADPYVTQFIHAQRRPFKSLKDGAA